jgi:transposase, IS30 family
MDQPNFTTDYTTRKKGKHLTLDERGVIQALYEMEYPLRKIAAALNCSPSTIYYELKRGTPERNGNRGRNPKYNAKRGQEVYEENRTRSKRHYIISAPEYKEFLEWVVSNVKEYQWSLDTCVGCAKKTGLFPNIRIPCTKTLYNMLHINRLPLSLFDFPEILSRKIRKPCFPKNKRIFGRSIDERPEIVSQKSEIGHWEIDTVVGRRSGKEPVLFTALEKVTRKFIVIKISGKTTAGIEEAMNSLIDTYGDKFSKVFKTITADNGSEFATLSKYEFTDCKFFFAHPYSSWERGQNERHNRILRRFIRKGQSIKDFTDKAIAKIENMINQMPRKILNYACSDDLFDAFLREVYETQE